MKSNIFTGEVTWKGIFAVLAVLTAGVGLFFGGRFLYQVYEARPKSAASVKHQIFAFLKTKAETRDFSVPLPKDSAGECGALSNQWLAIRADIANLQANLANLQKEIRTNREDAAAVALEVRRMKRAAGLPMPKRRLNTNDQAQLALSSTNSAPAQEATNALAIVSSNAASQMVLATNLPFDLVAASQTNEALKPIVEKEKTLTARQEKVTQLQQEIQKLNARITARQKDGWAKQREINALLNGSALQTRINKEFQQKIQEAPTWEALYKALGQELWVADQFLSSTNPSLRQSGLQLADQVRSQASNAAESDWLAARVCEAFIWPNLDLADNATRDQLLVSAGLIFRQAGETNNFIKNSEMLISKTSNPMRADYARYQLGFAFEMMGSYEASLKTYRAIQTSNSMLYAAKRIPIVENKLKALAGQKK